VELVHAPELPERELPASGWPAGVAARVLSLDDETGALTAVLRLPAGYRRHEGHYPAESELLVLGGTLRIGDELRAFGHYEYAPAGATQPAWSTESGAELLLLVRGGRPDLLPGAGPGGADGRIEHDTELMEWAISPIEGPPEGMVLKILRHVEVTGELTALCASVPLYDYPMLEFHDCIEEIYLLDGDIRLGNSGLMTAGSYLWRPPFVTHGPFFSRSGALMLVWVPSTLVNHVPASAASTPEENVAAFVAAGGQRVLGPAG